MGISPRETPAEFARDFHIHGSSFDLPGISIWQGSFDDPTAKLDIHIVSVNFLLIIMLTLITPLVWIIRRYAHRSTRLGPGGS